jgi:hypothetical protein
MLVVWRYCAPPHPHPLPFRPDQYYYKGGSTESTDATQGSPATNRFAVAMKTTWQKRVDRRHRTSPVTPATHPPYHIKIPPSIQQLTNVITRNPLRVPTYKHISQPHCRIVTVWMYLGKCIRTCLYLLCIYVCMHVCMYVCVCVYINNVYVHVNIYVCIHKQSSGFVVPVIYTIIHVIRRKI